MSVYMCMYIYIYIYILCVYPRRSQNGRFSFSRQTNTFNQSNKSNNSVPEFDK